MSDLFEEHGRKLLRSLKNEAEPTLLERSRLRTRIANKIAEGAHPELDGVDDAPDLDVDISSSDIANTGAHEVAGSLGQAAVHGISKTVAVLMTAAGVAVGAVGGAVTNQALQEPRIVVQEVEVPAAVPAQEEPHVELDAEIAPPDEAQSAPAASSSPTGTNKIETHEPIANRQERALLRQAHAALSRAEPEDALTVLEAHRRSFPRTSFAEERDALEIQALVAANEEERAALRAERFIARYPQSVFLPRVRAVLRH